ncbi:MAG: exodeoxyribonuclease III, partial [archaeon]
QVEIDGIQAYIDNGFVDTFREFNKEPHQYSYWSYRQSARSRNVGWRIDYFLVSEVLKSKVKDSFILQKVMGSDHCPVGLSLEK